jgi:hypothetical protein
MGGGGGGGEERRGWVFLIAACQVCVSPLNYCYLGEKDRGIKGWYFGFEGSCAVK